MWTFIIIQTLILKDFSNGMMMFLAPPTYYLFEIEVDLCYFFYYCYDWYFGYCFD